MSSPPPPAANSPPPSLQESLQKHASSFKREDLHPHPLPPHVAPPPPQRTVLVPGTSWTAASTLAVLDALHLSFLSPADEHREELRLSRCAGAVPVDPALADLFDDPVTATPFAQSLPLIQCLRCARPVLFTRFSAHAENCEVPDTKPEDARAEDAEEDEELRLIVAPYGAEFPNQGSFARLPRKSRAGVKRARPRVVAADEDEAEGGSAPKRKRHSFPLDEDDWKTTLSPVLVEYKPRCSMAKMRRVPLPVVQETPAGRKKTLNMERKAMLVANSTGIFKLPPKERQEDPLRVAAMRFGPTAPWSKLMQAAMPVMTPKVQKKAFLAPPETSFVAPGGLQVAFVPPGQGGGKVRQETQSEKHIGLVKQAVPTLVGSLMYMRGMGGKDLATSGLHQMDVPQTPVSKTISAFHGQKYFAEMGTFESDPRTAASIKLPLAAVTPYMPPLKQTTNANSTNVGASADARGRKFSAKAQAPATASPAPTASANHPVITKKQRNSKTQRGQAPTTAARMANGQAQARPAQTPRKGASSRSSAGTTPTTVKAANSADSHQRPAVGRTSAQNSASIAMTAALSAASAAASKYSTQQQLTMQAKNAFRQMSAPASLSPSVRVGTVQPLPTVASAPTGVHVNMKGNARVSKGRSHASPSQSNAAMAMRVAAAGNKVKTPSPSQASSRSGERLPMHRDSPIATGVYHDPMLLASSQQNATTSAMNRMNAGRGGAPKPQMDFRQVMAHVARNPSRDIASPGMSRGAVLHTSPKGQLIGADKLAAQRPQQNLRRMTTQARSEHAALQNAQVKQAAKNRQRQVQNQLRKDDVLQKAHELRAQLGRADPLPADMIPGDVGKLNDPSLFIKGPNRANLMMNPNGHASQGFYSAALRAPAAQLSHNETVNQRNLALLGMAQAKQKAMAARTGAPGAPNILQSMQDLRPMQNIGVVPGMQPAAHNANMFNFLQASGLSGGMPQTGGMSNPVAPGMPGAGMMSGANPGMMNSSEALFRQMLAANQTQGRNPNAPLHAGPMATAGAPLNVHGHQGVRTGPMGPIPPQQVMPQSSDAALHEIDRLLGLNFEEKDLMD